MQPTVKRGTRRARAAVQRGFSMIEALIGAMVFAIGVLGVVGLQANMTQTQVASKARADAVNLAQELVGIMWSDLDALAQYSTGGGGGGACANNVRCSGWMDKVARDLPSANIDVQVVPIAAMSGNGANVIVTLRWPSKLGEQVQTLSSTVMSQAPLAAPPPVVP
jgi:type IV pilus assembly protein PilV